MDKPTIGQAVTVVVPNSSAVRTNLDWFPNEPDTVTYIGTVLQPYRWLSFEEFCLSNDDPNWPIRVINMKNVLSINGSKVPQKKVSTKHIEVKGKHGTYTVVIAGNSTTCTCPGFQFRKHCSHINTVLDKQSKKAK